MTNNSATFWSSLLGAKKAVAAGLAWVTGFLSAALVTSGGQVPTWQEFAIAAAGYVPAHAVTYRLTNEGTVNVAKLLQEGLTNPVVARLVAQFSAVVPAPVIVPIPVAEPVVLPTASAPAADVAEPADLAPIVNTTINTGPVVPLASGTFGVMSGRHRARLGF